MSSKEEFKMNGVTILGICLGIIGLLSIISGVILHPVNFLDGDFMSLIVGGVVFITIGVCIISGISPKIKIATIWVSAISMMLYIFSFEMDLIFRLMNFVPIIGVAIWITTKLLK